MRFKMLALVAAVAVTVPAVAQSADPAVAAAAPKKEKKVCRRYAVTGSIVSTRTECHTAAEWATIDSVNARGVDDTLGNSRNRARQ